MASVNAESERAWTFAGCQAVNRMTWNAVGKRAGVSTAAQHYPFVREENWLGMDPCNEGAALEVDQVITVCRGPLC